MLVWFLWSGWWSAHLLAVSYECVVCLTGPLLFINKFNYKIMSLLMQLRRNRQGYSQRGAAELEARQKITPFTAKHHCLINCLKQWKFDMRETDFRLTFTKVWIKFKWYWLLKFHLHLLVICGLFGNGHHQFRALPLRLATAVDSYWKKNAEYIYSVLTLFLKLH